MNDDELKLSDQKSDISHDNGITAVDNFMAFSPTQLIMVAVQQGFDIQRLEKLIELQRAWEQNEARKAYHHAMARFKKNPPQIFKDMKAKVQTTKGTYTYNYASLGNIVERLISALADYGFSSRWETQQKDGKIIVTNIITHELGHSEKVTLELPYDTSGYKNPIQSIGSAQSYGERYTFLANIGLATNEFETDANAPKDDRKIFERLEKKMDQLPHDSSDGFESEKQRRFFLDWQAADQEIRTKQFSALVKNYPNFSIKQVFPELNLEKERYEDLPIQAQVKILWYLTNQQKAEQK